MPINPQEFLRCVSEPYTAVRDTNGNLLGCIPRVNTDIGDGIRGLDGRAYEFRYAATVCVCVPDGAAPRLPGFIPLDMGKNADLALPPVVEP
jgi:hypothetical protein